MTRRLVVGGVIAGVTALGMALAPMGPLGARIWPAPTHGGEPAGLQIPLFVGFGFLEALFMGLGTAFLLFGWGYTKRVFAAAPRLAPVAHVSVAWVMGNWWVHDNLHTTLAPGNLSGLLALEYGFHVTLMFSGLVLAYGVVLLARRPEEPAAAPARRDVAVPPAD